MIDSNLKNDTIKQLSKFFTNKLSKLLTEEICKFSATYSEENEAPFLEQSIFETKVTELIDVFTNNKNLVKDIKKNSDLVYIISNMKPEELQPDKYIDILNKKKIEEYRKIINW